VYNFYISGLILVCHIQDTTIKEHILSLDDGEEEEEVVVEVLMLTGGYNVDGS
jgi:hypothetical protein